MDCRNTRNRRNVDRVHKPQFRSLTRHPRRYFLLLAFTFLLALFFFGVFSPISSEDGFGSAYPNRFKLVASTSCEEVS
jgi:hypothetical protein